MCLLDMVLYQLRKVLYMSKSISSSGPKKWKKEASIDSDTLFLDPKIAQNLLSTFLTVFSSHVVVRDTAAMHKAMHN